MAVLDTESVLIGEIYLVRGRRGCWRSATVLDKRVIKNGGVEFYMHFDGDDRRLDHWVASSRLKLRKRPHHLTNQLFGNEIRERRVRKGKENFVSSIKVDYSEDLEDEHKKITEVKYIEVVRYGEFEIDTWYVSPYPDEYEKDKYLFICDRCFLYMRQERTYKIHLSTCNTKHPPGKEIYQDNVENIIVYEVDGEREKLYSQCLCLFAKLFMDHKAIYFDVSGFLFYVICEWNESGYLRAVGYFSKERVSSDGHNLNCILVFPPFQRHGYGSFLIQLSYELSRRQGVLGSPEKPLSDLGLLSYRHFWAYMIVDHLSSLMDMSWIRVTELANELGMQIDDVITTLEWLQLYEPSTVSETPKDTEPWVLIHLKTLDKLRKLVARPPRLMMNARLLHWRPCV